MLNHETVGFVEGYTPEQVSVREPTQAADQVRRSRLARVLASGLAVFGLSAGAISFPKEASLDLALVASDLHSLSVLNNDPAASASELSTRPYQGFSEFQSDYAAGNGLYKQNFFSYGPAWAQAVTISSLQDLSLLGSKHHSEYASTLKQDEKASQLFWDPKPTSGQPGGFNPNLSLLPVNGTLGGSLMGLILPEINLGSSRFVDDNLWIGQNEAKEDIEAHKLQHLGQIENIVKLAVSQWSKKGGIFWEEQLPNVTDRSRGMVSNAPFTVLCTWLYKETGNPFYLHWAKKADNWEQHTLYNPQTKTYNDHISGRQVDNDQWTYTTAAGDAASYVMSQVDPTQYPVEAIIKRVVSDLKYNQQNHLYGSEPSFDSVALNYYVDIAASYHKPWFNKLVHRATVKALHADLETPRSLINDAGTLGVEALAHLPTSSYSKVSNLL